MQSAYGTVMVVDRPGMDREMATRRLRREGYDVQAADDAREAIASLGRAPVDLVVMADALPGVSGLELLGLLRQRFNRGELPVVMTGARKGRAAAALAAGASDALPGCDPTELAARVQARLDDLRHDPLTGLLAGPAFRAEVAQACARAQGRGRRAELLTVEVADLRAFQDEAGAACADAALRAFAARLAALVPGSRAGRLGGATFGLLLPDRPRHEDGRAAVAAVLQAAMEPYDAAGQEAWLTPVVGCASTADAPDAPGLFRAAEASARIARKLGNLALLQAA